MRRIGFRIDRNGLPNDYPTHLHKPKFWAELGRTIATFGFLEETLGRAIFAISLTTEYDEKDIDKALTKWRLTLPLNLTDTLPPLAERFEAGVKAHQTANSTGAAQIAAEVKRLAEIRNALCHGSWRKPDAMDRSQLHYIAKKAVTDAGVKPFEPKISTKWLRQWRAETLALICDVIDTVTELGWQFPGSAGPGDEVWPRSTGKQ
jgi:hypothetical protein